MNPLETLAPSVMTCSMVVLSACILATFLRTIIGPRMSDRIIGVNMIGTQAVCVIVCLTLRLNENWLADIAIIYAMFSFLSVAVLTKMDIGVYREWRDNQRKSRERDRINKENIAAGRNGRQRRRKKTS